MSCKLLLPQTTEAKQRQGYCNAMAFKLDGHGVLPYSLLIKLF